MNKDNEILNLQKQNELLRQHKIGGIGLFDKNDKQIEVGHIISILNTYTAYIDHQIGGPIQTQNDIFLVFFQNGKYELRYVNDWNDYYGDLKFEQYIDTIDDSQFEQSELIITGKNVIFGKKYIEYDWIQEFNKEDVQILGMYNEDTNQIYFQLDAMSDE